MSSSPTNVPDWVPLARTRLLQGLEPYKQVTVAQTTHQTQKQTFTLLTLRLRGPDDAVYSKHRQVWSLLPRGQSYVFDAAGTQIATIQGFRKFGYFEDRERLPYGDFSRVQTIQAMEKENGENAQVTAFQYQGHLYWLAGSKNVHIVFQCAADLQAEVYKDQRYTYALRIAQLVLDSCSEKKFPRWLADTKFTAIGEALLSESQHLVDYKGQRDCIRFFGLSSAECSDLKLTAMPPADALQTFKGFGLQTASLLDPVPRDSEAFTALMRNAAFKQNSEGWVLYCMDADTEVQAMYKVKSIGYVLERVVRETTCRGLSRAAIHQAVEKSGTRIFAGELENQAAEQWIRERLPFLLRFSGWVQATKTSSQSDDIRNRWISLQHEFQQVEQQNALDVDWWSQVRLVQAGSRVIAARGLPCSGKSMTMRSLKIVLDRLGQDAVWINQDELGSRRLYLNAFRRALDVCPKFILLDKSNREEGNLTDITEILGAQIDLLLDFIHPDDTGGETQHALNLCRERHASRKDGHRTLRSDADIDRILGMMAGLSLNPQKLSRLATTIESIDMTSSPTEMLNSALKAICPKTTVNPNYLQEATSISLGYEKLLAEDTKRSLFFALMLDSSYLQALQQHIPPSVLKDKISVRSPHITLSYHGDFVSPAEYLRHHRLSQSDEQHEARVVSLHWDGKAVCAKVELDESKLAWSDKDSFPHITIALAEKTKAVYSQTLLMRSNPGGMMHLQPPLVVCGPIRGFRSQFHTLSVSSINQVKTKKIASDIGNVIYSSYMTSFEDHVIEKGTQSIEGSLQGLKQLKDAQLDISLISYCGEETERRTRKRLVEDGVHLIVPFKKWFFCRERMEKPAIMKREGISLLIDDREDIVAACRDQGLDAIWFGTEVSTWDEVCEMLIEKKAEEDIGDTA